MEIFVSDENGKDILCVSKYDSGKDAFFHIAENAVASGCKDVEFSASSFSFIEFDRFAKAFSNVGSVRFRNCRLDKVEMSDRFVKNVRIDDCSVNNSAFTEIAFMGDNMKFNACDFGYCDLSSVRFGYFTNCSGLDWGQWKGNIDYNVNLVTSTKYLDAGRDETRIGHGRELFDDYSVDALTRDGRPVLLQEYELGYFYKDNKELFTDTVYKAIRGSKLDRWKFPDRNRQERQLAEAVLGIKGMENIRCVAGEYDVTNDFYLSFGNLGREMSRLACEDLEFDRKIERNDNMLYVVTEKKRTRSAKNAGRADGRSGGMEM